MAEFYCFERMGDYVMGRIYEEQLKYRDVRAFASRIMKSKGLTARFEKKSIAQLRKDCKEKMAKMLTMMVLLSESRHHSMPVWLWWEGSLGIYEMVRIECISASGIVEMCKLLFVANAIIKELYSDVWEAAQVSEDRSAEYFTKGYCFGSDNPSLYVNPKAFNEYIKACV